MSQHSSVIPCLRYRDANAAISWLCNVFGFQRQLIVPGEGDLILHAQLSLGSGMLMLGSATDNAYGSNLKQPDEIGGFSTQSTYVVVPDADQVYARARQAGAHIVLEITDQDYGGRGFTCRDPEGHLWSVGSYDPWSELL